MTTPCGTVSLFSRHLEIEVLEGLERGYGGDEGEVRHDDEISISAVAGEQAEQDEHANGEESKESDDGRNVCALAGRALFGLIGDNAGSLVGGHRRRRRHKGGCGGGRPPAGTNPRPPPERKSRRSDRMSAAVA